MFHCLFNDYAVLKVDCNSQTKYNNLLNTLELPYKYSTVFSKDYALMKVECNSQTKYLIY